MSIVRKRGRTIQSDERNLISNIIKCCENEAKQKYLILPINRSIDRAAIYCRVSTNTIRNIKKEAKIINQSSSSCTDRLPTPGKNRPRPDYRNATLDKFDRRVVIDILEDFYINRKIVLTCDKLLLELKEKINFKWKLQTLRNLLRLAGFKWKQCKKRRRILVERQDIINKRYKYLQMLKSYKENDLPVFYLDETWVDSNLTFKKYWQNEEYANIRKGNNSLNRLIIVHIGSKTGFLEGCEFIFEEGPTKGDYTGQIMDSENFERWIQEVVIPKLPSPSIIVMDNATYHSRIVNKPPSKSSIKKDMIEYLQKMGVLCDEKMRKCTLYELILSVQPQEKTYEVDKLFECHGHKVLRLPPYMSELNPIESAWIKLENYVRENKTPDVLSVQFLRELVKKGLKSITSEDWVAYCKHVETLEDKYWSTDGIMEDAVDNFIIEFGASEAKLTNNGDSSESENDSEEDGYVGEEEDASSGEESNDSFMEGCASD